jgi:hypothetical protein
MMQRRTLAITMLGLLVTLFLLAESSFAYVRYYRLQRELHRPPRSEQVEQFIAGLRAGNTQQFRYVEYDLLKGVANQYSGVMETIVVLAAEQNENWVDWLTDDGDVNVRARVIRSTLAGLRNLDPSVRLTALNILRRLRPESSMQIAVKQALARETVASQWEYWRERNIDIPSSENPWLEGATFWDEDVEFGYNNAAPWVRRFYGDRGSSTGNFWGYQEGQANVTDGFNGSWTFEDTTHNSGSTSVNPGQGSWAERADGWRGAAVPSGGSWNRPNDDIRPYVGDYSLKYLCLKYDFPTNSFVEIYANPWAESYKLDLFITRAVWYEKIKAGHLNSMVIISKDTFKALYLSIDGENPERIPFPSTATNEPLLDASDIAVLIQGLLRNSVVTNRWVMARALKYIYRMSDTTDAERVQIIRAIRRAKYQENRIDIYRGDELYNELVAETTQGVTSRGTGLGFPLGFNPADDETDVPTNPINISPNIVFDDNGTAVDEDDAYVVSPQLSNNPSWASGQTVRVVDALGNPRVVSDSNGSPINTGWQIDAEGIERAQAIIDAVRLGATDILDSALYEDVRNAVLITLYRLNTQTGHENVRDPLNPNLTGADAPWLQFFSALQGERINSSSAMGPGSGLNIAKRTAIIRSSLSGLVNPDPRVRLTCIHWLRRCNPDSTMLEEVQEAWDIESVLYVPAEADPQGIDRGDHEFIDTEGYILSKEANEELRKLYKFIVRRQLIDLITSGAGRNVLAEVPRSRFMTLTSPIDNEDLTMIPLYSVDPNINPNNDGLIRPNMLSTVAYGIRNPNFLNQKETAIYLIRYYNAYVTFDDDEWDVDEGASLLTPTVRNALINAIMEAKEDDIVIFESEALLTGELEIQGRAVVRMFDPDTGEPNSLAMATTYRNQWNNAVAIREGFGTELQE